MNWRIIVVFMLVFLFTFGWGFLGEYLFNPQSKWSGPAVFGMVGGVGVTFSSIWLALLQENVEIKFIRKS